MFFFLSLHMSLQLIHPQGLLLLALPTSVLDNGSHCLYLLLYSRDTERLGWVSQEGAVIVSVSKPDGWERHVPESET